MIFIATCIAAYYMRNVFFRGYEATAEWPFERGWFISGCLALTTLNVIYSCTQIVKPISTSRIKLLKIFIINRYWLIYKSTIVENYIIISF